jgi:hypothetical protein
VNLRLLIRFQARLSFVAMPVYAPIAPPFLESAEAPGELTPDQASMTAKVLEHFSKPDYLLPGLEKGELGEEEKFWLVRPNFILG